MANTQALERNGLLRAIDKVSNVCGAIGVIMIVFVTVILTYEAIGRYFFHAPTQWTQDISVTLQVWFTYLGMALVLKEGKMIRITALLGVAPAWMRYACEGLALIIIFLFSVMAVVKGWDVVADSIRLGRREPTMLALPNWISELPVVLGFALLAIQSLAELVRLPFRGPPSFAPDSEIDTAQINAQITSQGEVRA